jgi:hypothetical protein
MADENPSPAAMIIFLFDNRPLIVIFLLCTRFISSCSGWSVCYPVGDPTGFFIARRANGVGRVRQQSPKTALHPAYRLKTAPLFR